MAIDKRNERVVITGMGIILPGADNVADFWNLLSKGESQISKLTRFETENFPVKCSAELNNFDFKKYLPDLDEKLSKNYNQETLALMSAMEMAQKDAGLKKNSIDPSRVGFVDSSSRASLAWWEHAWNLYHSNKDDSHFDRYAVMTSMASNPTNLTAIRANIQGFVTTVSAACVGGHHAISLCYQAIRKGRSQVMYAGGHEFPLIKPLMQMYSDPKSRVMSMESENPSRAMKPYDKKRDGFILGEGAMVLCLESYSHAVQRKARIYAEVLGGLSYNEADHALRMDLTGVKAGNGLKNLIRISRRDLMDVDYFCGHGTATYNNDLAESRAIQKLYAGKPKKYWAPVGSVKPIFGHTFGAAGIINAGATALMIHNQAVCPTINLDEPDVECDHDHVAEGLRRTRVKFAISMAFAIGSQTSFISLGEVD
ncbi:MAG: beta-ketoacyl-[acyl-carrier-protein] synthase family protein [Leptospiraceae bacterium]|nr:beta-ketoacyl-[acyl-carrier-protein] synthase family protein [Leptospiraceae bacterium]